MNFPTFKQIVFYQTYSRETTDKKKKNVDILTGLNKVQFT